MNIEPMGMKRFVVILSEEEIKALADAVQDAMAHHENIAGYHNRRPNSPGEVAGVKLDRYARLLAPLQGYVTPF